MIYRWYLYTLSDNDGVFYVGITESIWNRYAQHCTINGGICSPHIYWIRLNGELPKLTIINSFQDKFTALNSEDSLIYYFSSINHKLFNIDKNQLKNQRIHCIPDYSIKYKRLKPNVFKNICKDALIEFEKRQIYNEGIRHFSMDNTASVSQ